MFTQQENLFCLSITFVRRRVCASIKKWLDRFFGSRNHQHICMGCYADDIGISNSVHWWSGFLIQNDHTVNTGSFNEGV